MNNHVQLQSQQDIDYKRDLYMYIDDLKNFEKNLYRKLNETHMSIQFAYKCLSYLGLEYENDPDYIFFNELDRAFEEMVFLDFIQEEEDMMNWIEQTLQKENYNFVESQKICANDDYDEFLEYDEFDGRMC